MKRDVRVVKIACGHQHNLALTSSGLVLSWGGGDYGQLGHGSVEMETTPGVIGHFLDLSVEDVVCGADSSYALVRSPEGLRQIYSWGWGWEGRLGHADRGDMPVPRLVSALGSMNVTKIACGDAHVLAIVNDGDLWTFGRNTSGQVGLGHVSNHVAPTLVPALEGCPIADVACGAEHSVAATATGKLFTWGWNRYGNLGDGTTDERHTPTEIVTGLEGVAVVAVVAGWRHTMAMSRDGAFYIWGWNKYGQLGVGDFVDRPTPQACALPGGKAVRVMAAGWRHSAVVDTEGKLFTWGWNGFGQLGIGSKDQQPSPQVVGGALEGKPVELVACGWRHTLARTDDGQLFSWGIGASGQLGTGQMLNSLVPAPVSLLSQPKLAHDELAKHVITPEVEDIPSELRALLGGDVSLDDTFHVPAAPGTMGAGPDAKRQKGELGE